MGAVSVEGGPPPPVELIQRLVRQCFGRFRLCYQKGLSRNSQLRGQVDVRFVIGLDGQVSQLSSSGDLPDPAMVECVTQCFRGLSFPPPAGGAVTVNVPLTFTPGTDASTD